MKMCEDCVNCRILDGSAECMMKWISPVRGRIDDLTCHAARSFEWACGAEGWGWQAKDEPKPRRMQANPSAIRGKHSREHEEDGLCKVSPCCRPIDHQYVLLSDLAEEFGEERVREWASKLDRLWIKIYLHGRSLTDWSLRTQRLDSIMYSIPADHIRVTADQSDEFRREMKEQHSPDCDYMDNGPDAIQKPCNCGLHKHQPQAQDCPVCGSKALLVTEPNPKYPLAICSGGCCISKDWCGLHIWNRLRLAPKKEGEK